MLLEWSRNHNFIKDQVPALRSRVKENRVRVPDDPVTVSGRKSCIMSLCESMRRRRMSDLAL